MKHLLIVFLLLIQSNIGVAQDWKFMSSKDMKSLGITSVTGNRFIHERLWQLHQYKQKTIGSSLFVQVNSNGDFQDRVLFMPNNFLLLIFKSNGEINWVMTKIVSSYWQNTADAIYNQEIQIPFFSEPRRGLTLQEQNALSSLFNRIKSVYCSIDEASREEIQNSLKEYFGEEELSTTYNEVVKKYLKAKKEYETFIKKYNQEVAKYEKEMKAYETRLEKAKQEYEQWVKDDKRYHILKGKYDEYQRKLEAFRSGLSSGSALFSNLKAIYDFADHQKVYFVDQDNGFIAYEHIVHNTYNNSVYKDILYQLKGMNLGTQIPVGKEIVGLSVGIFPLGASDVIPAPKGIRLLPSVLTYYGLKEYKEETLNVNTPVPPANPEEIKAPSIKKPQASKGPKKPELEKGETLISTPNVTEEDYQRGLTACPPILSKGLFDFSAGTKDINTYIIDAPEATSVQDWLLFTGGKCHKCQGWKKSWLTELYSPKYQIGIRINKVTEKIGALTNPEHTLDRDQVLSNIYRAYQLAIRGVIHNNELKYLGKDGFTYSKSNGIKVLNLKGQEVNYQPRTLPAKSIFAFETWQKLFCRYPLDISDIFMDDAIVSELFEDIAEGKHHWISYYRQTPLAFLAKYCEIITNK
ncbi:MAG: hypothetical protein MI974_29965 [Chitinophagales bacterium]|nr:hypothetical protein [Chitinophagales bacterium]